MTICKLCGREFKNLSGVSSHLKQIHKANIEEYYLKYIGNEGKCEECDKKTNFISMQVGYHKFCSTKCSNNSEEKKEKCSQTNLKKYGTECVLQNNEIKEKIKKTNLKKYGSENVMNSEEIKEKMKQNNLEKYGVECTFQWEEQKKKTKKIMLEKYGVEHPSYSKEIQRKTKETLKKRYGEDHPSRIYKFINKFKESYRKTMYERLIHSNRLKEKCIPLFDIDDYSIVEKKYQWKCTKCSTIFESNLEDGKIPRCPECYPILISTSKFEQEVIEFCKQYYPNLIENDREILADNKELDIFIPEINLAIECNGLYWHSDLQGKDENYHLFKTLKCQEKNIQLIHIFEDEWYNKQDIIESILLAKMGKIEDKIYARKCQIKDVPKNEADDFLFENHLQGPINGKSVGLYYEDDLVSILTYGKPRFNKNYDLEILRFCNKKNTIVIGGLSKLVKRIQGKIISYCDLRYSDGKGYLSANFKFSKHSNPNYFYLKNNQRYSRIQFQKHKLSKVLESYDPNLTEWENMQLNGYDRIWDCGNLVFNMEIL